jgi:hypothetical protein
MQCGVLAAANTSQGSRPAPPPPIITCNEVQNIRVNVHFMQHDDGTGNFTANDDGRPGNPNSGTTGFGYAQVLIGTCNDQMDQSPVLNLYPGNTLTPIPKRVRWVLDGVYFHQSSYYRNGAYNPNHSPPLLGLDYASRCVRGDSVINIFLVEEELWPYNSSGTPVPSPAIRGYVQYQNQATCDTRPAPTIMWAVVSSPWTKYIVGNTGAWDMAGAVNHELCHLLGLNHPYEYSSYGWGECPDAPANANCWNVDLNNSNCNDLSKVSNNVMDYNASQSALAPCQIGIIQNNLNTCLKSRFVYKCSDCMPPIANFELPPGTCGSLANIWLDGRATWNANSFNLEIDQVYNAAPTIVVPGTHYEAYNWRPLGREQLDALYTFAANSIYQVKITVRTPNGCATAVRVRTFNTSACSNLTIPTPLPTSAATLLPPR